VTAVVRPAKTPGNEAAGDLRILNRNARRLNREARDVLSFQVPVWSAVSCIEFDTLPAEIRSVLGFLSRSAARSWSTPSFRRSSVLRCTRVTMLCLRRCRWGSRKVWSMTAASTVTSL